MEVTSNHAMKESAVVVLRHVVSAVSVVKMSFMYVTWLGQSPSAFVSFRHGQLSLQARDLHSLDCSSTRLASLSSQLEVLIVLEALPLALSQPEAGHDQVASTEESCDRT